MNYITEQNFEAFREAYCEAALKDLYSFTFEGQEVLVAYAKYLCQYVMGLYPYSEAVVGSSFYAIEEGTDQECCDTCHNAAQLQTFGKDDTLYLACRNCVLIYSLPCDGAWKGDGAAMLKDMPKPEVFS